MRAKQQIAFKDADFPLSGSDVLPSLLSSPHVHIKYIAQMPSFFRTLPFLLLAPIKVSWQVLSVLHALWYTPDVGAEYLLVQVRIQHLNRAEKPLIAVRIEST